MFAVSFRVNRINRVTFILGGGVVGGWRWKIDFKVLRELNTMYFFLIKKQ